MHRRVMQELCSCTLARNHQEHICICSGSSSSTSLFEILYFVLEMALPRRRAKAILPWVQCPGCEAWMKPTKKMVDFSEFADGDTYCDNCWMYWDSYNCWMYWDACNYYYYHWYPQCLQAVHGGSVHDDV